MNESELNKVEKFIVYTWRALVTVVIVNGIFFFPYWVLMLYKWITGDLYV